MKSEAVPFDESSTCGGATCRWREAGNMSINGSYDLKYYWPKNYYCYYCCNYYVNFCYLYYWLTPCNIPHVICELFTSKTCWWSYMVPRPINKWGSVEVPSWGRCNNNHVTCREEMGRVGGETKISRNENQELMLVLKIVQHPQKDRNSIYH